VVEEQPVRPLAPAEMEAATALLKNQTEQVPPMFSALKQGGKRLYQLAREGKEVHREARPITVYDARCTDSGEGWVRMLVTVSKGTYIRSFAELLGDLWQQPCHLEGLIRTAVGPFSLANATLPEDLTPQTPLLPLSLGLGDLPLIHLNDAQVKKARMGQKISLDSLRGPLPQAPARVGVMAGEVLLGLAQILPEALHVDRVLSDESP
jgi:tRNA pseudouridine55 synthase